VTTGPGSPLLVVNCVSKHFGGVAALSEVSLSLDKGQVLAVVGENGAGKSTLLNVMSGSVVPDRGTVRLSGAQVPLGRPRESLRRGIALVHQELTLFPNLTVAENVFIGHEVVGSNRRLARRALNESTVRLLTGLDETIDPATEVGELPLAQQQLVEIAKALSWEPKVLILDEATSALDGHEVERLFGRVRGLVLNGMAVIFVSHRLPEVLAICHRAVVLRDGQVVKVFEDLKGVGELDLVEAILGRSLTEMFPHKSRHRSCSPVLEVTGLRGGNVHGVDITVHGGEIVGLGGLDGHGQRDLLRLVFGLVRKRAGTVTVDGTQVEPRAPRAALDAGVGYVPQERKTEGLLLPLPVETNLTLSVLAHRLAGHGGLVRLHAERDLVRGLRQRLRIHQTRWHQAAESLSGGNQQKVVLGKWLARDCRLLLLDEPTRGVDIGARAQVYRLLRELADAGMAILIVSSDAAELLGLCDRVYVFYEGRVLRQLTGRDLNEQNLTAAILGVSPAEVTL
jgi:rhamnose transport system ATP-binding protein